MIEVAGTSLERDRTTKLRHYARGAIPQYVILELQDRTAEEHLDPDPSAGIYTTRIFRTTHDTLRLHLTDDERLDLAVGQLFPPS